MLSFLIISIFRNQLTRQREVQFWKRMDWILNFFFNFFFFTVSQSLQHFLFTLIKAQIVIQSSPSLQVGHVFQYDFIISWWSSSHICQDEKYDEARFTRNKRLYNPSPRSPLHRQSTHSLSLPSHYPSSTNLSLFLKSRARRSSPYLLCMMISVQVGSRQVGSWSVRKSKTESQLQPRLSLVQLPSSPYSHPRPSSLWFSEGIIILSYYVQSLFSISPWVNAWFYWSVYQNQERNETLIRLVTDVSPLSFLFFLFPLPTPPQKKVHLYSLYLWSHL